MRYSHDDSRLKNALNSNLGNGVRDSLTTFLNELNELDFEKIQKQDLSSEQPLKLLKQFNDIFERERSLNKAEIEVLKQNEEKLQLLLKALRDNSKFPPVLRLPHEKEISILAGMVGNTDVSQGALNSDIGNDKLEAFLKELNELDFERIPEQDLDSEQLKSTQQQLLKLLEQFNDAFGMGSVGLAEATALVANEGKLRLFLEALNDKLSGQLLFDHTEEVGALREKLNAVSADVNQVAVVSEIREEPVEIREQCSVLCKFFLSIQKFFRELIGEKLSALLGMSNSCTLRR